MSNPFINKYTIKTGEPATIRVDHERPLYQIKKALIKSDANKLAHHSFSFRISRISVNKRESIPPIHFRLKSNDTDLSAELSKVKMNVASFDELEISGDGATDFTMEIELENFAIEIDVKPLFADFKNHLDLKNNSRIFFSAPFGKGKTTFMNLFFEEHAEKYEVFHIFPVNYSVSSNEDIFKYIKAELLFQLLSRDLNFEKYDYTKYETLNYYISNLSLDEFLDSFLPFMKCIPKVGEALNTFLEPLIAFYNKIKKINDEQKIDEKKTALEYIKNLYQKEGSIYEDDLYTQLIRSLVKSIGRNNKVKTIFIIDDLDRLDPEHIFRILNIFSAHFDNHIYNFHGDNNKFGFDKIILSADYHNIFSIYAHKFGINTDFKGYINKYYSLEPYFFDNDKLMKKELWKLFDGVKSSVLMALSILLTIMVERDLFNIRDMINLMKLNLASDKLFEQRTNGQKNNRYAYFVLISYLLKIFNNKEVLIGVIKRATGIKENISNVRHRALMLFAEKYGFCFKYVLGNGDKQKSKIQYNGKQHFFAVMLDDNSDYFMNRYLCVVDFSTVRSQANETFEFTGDDFFTLLLINIDEYYKHGGLDGKEDE